MAHLTEARKDAEPHMTSLASQTGRVVATSCGASASPQTSSLPLVVDLDGTLLATDSLHEQAIHLLFRNPAVLVQAALAGTQGRAGIKRAIAASVPEADPTWPLNEEFFA